MARLPSSRCLLVVALAALAAACGGSDDEPTVCEDVSGAWSVVESATLSCTGVLEGLSGPQSGNGTLTITQDVCRISFTSPLDILRSGIIDGSAIELSGPAAVVNPVATVSRNRITFTGTLSADKQRIELAGSGGVTLTFQGQDGNCNVTSQATFTR